MARKKKKARTVAADRVRVLDEELIKRLETTQEGREVLSGRMPEALFDTAVEGLLNEFPLPDEMPHFYCRKCGEYHLKTHLHYRDGPT